LSFLYLFKFFDENKLFLYLLSAFQLYFNPAIKPAGTAFKDIETGSGFFLASSQSRKNHFTRGLGFLRLNLLSCIHHFLRLKIRRDFLFRFFCFV
jgi:hypothetical protein